MVANGPNVVVAGVEKLEWDESVVATGISVATVVVAGMVTAEVGTIGGRGIVAGRAGADPAGITG